MFVSFIRMYLFYLGYFGDSEQMVVVFTTILRSTCPGCIFRRLTDLSG